MFHAGPHPPRKNFMLNPRGCMYGKRHAALVGHKAAAIVMAGRSGVSTLIDKYLTAGADATVYKL